MPKKIASFLLLTLIFFASSWSLFNPGFFRVHDYVHGARIVEMYRGLAEGQLPVRWSENFGYGYGMPLYLFYAPLPYYVGAFFYWLTFDVILSVRLLFLLVNLGTVIGGYRLGKKLYGRTGGILVSAAIALAPYRAVNLFVRGALSEAWAIMFMPYILDYGLEVIDRSQKKWSELTKFFAGLVLSVAGLMLSHNLTTLMFVPVSFGFLVVMSWLRSLYQGQKWQARSLLYLLGGFGLAGGVSAFYMLPAVVEKDATQIESILSGYFHYSHHFLYIRQFLDPRWAYGGSEWGPNDGLSFFFGWGQWLGLAIVAGLALQKLVRALRTRSMSSTTLAQLLMVSLSGLMVGMSLYLSLLKSKWLWDLIPVLPFIQFPWRWLSVGVIFIALLVGVVTLLLKSQKALLGYGLVTLVLLLVNSQYFRPEQFLADPTGYYYSDETRIREQMSDILPDYLPKDLDITTLKPRQEGELVRESDEVKSKLRELLVDKGHEKLLNVDLHEETPITFTVAYFPGWQAEVDYQPVPVLKSPEGLVDVMVPKSKHTVAIYFGRTPIRTTADIITLISVLIFLGLLLPVKTAYESNRH